MPRASRTWQAAIPELPAPMMQAFTPEMYGKGSVPFSFPLGFRPWVKALAESVGEKQGAGVGRRNRPPFHTSGVRRFTPWGRSCGAGSGRSWGHRVHKQRKETPDDQQDP